MFKIKHQTKKNTYILFIAETNGCVLICILLSSVEMRVCGRSDTCDDAAFRVKKITMRRLNSSERNSSS